MRRFSFSLLVVLGITLLAGCTKDESTIRVVTRPLTGITTPPPAGSNTPPQAYAGRDIWVMFPASTATLSGSASYQQGDFVKWQWRQVAGPGMSLIAYPDSGWTQVSRLQKGTYAFELTVTNRGGLSGKDTVSLSVVDPAPPAHGEVIFKDLPLNCPMGCHLWIDCLFCKVPVDQPIKVYLRETNTTQWFEVVPDAQWTVNDKYSYVIERGNMVIYTLEEPNTTADVKVTY